MMINKQLINTVKESKKYIADNVICQWISLCANIAMMCASPGCSKACMRGRRAISPVFGVSAGTGTCGNITMAG